MSLFAKLQSLWRRPRQSAPAPADPPPPNPDNPAPADRREADRENPARELMMIDPFKPGSPWPAGRCEVCVETKHAGYYRPAEFEPRLAAALERILGDGAAARRYAAEAAAGRLCSWRARRILARAGCVVCGGGPLEVRLARVYAAGELARLAMRCGIGRKPT